MDSKNLSSSPILSANEVTVIDLAIKDDVKTITNLRIQEIGKQLDHALATDGFALLINHGISEDKITSVYKVMNKFCALPDDVKSKYKIKTSTGKLHGYLPIGLEMINVGGPTEVKHCFNISTISWTLPTEEISDFKQKVGGLVDEFLQLTNLILKVIADALGWNPDTFIQSHKSIMDANDNPSTLRLAYYPPIEEEPTVDMTRCGEHTDWGTFTFLTQDVDGGFEVLNDGEWKRISFIPGAILLFTAEMLEVLTCSKYKAVLHRVVAPKEAELRNKCRHSNVFFVSPDNDTVIAPSTFNKPEKLTKNETPTNSHTALEIYHKKYNALHNKNL